MELKCCYFFLVSQIQFKYFKIWLTFLLKLPVVEMLLLALPIHLAIHQNGWYMIASLVLTFTLEFAVGWYATNQQLSTWMIVKIILSIGLFWLFYRKKLEFSTSGNV